MENRNVRARNELRAAVPENYSHIRHLALNTLITLAPILVFAFLLATYFTFNPLALLAIPVGFLLGNFIEYAAHRWPMHRPSKLIGKKMFKRHAGEHHRAFDMDFMEITDPRDYFMVMLPTRTALKFMLVATALTVLGGFIGGGAFAAVLGITLCGYFFAEEMLHLSFHFKSTWEGDRWIHRALRRIGRWHRLHHELKLMTRWNFNIAFPVFDKMLGTLIDVDDPVVQSKCGDKVQEIL